MSQSATVAQRMLASSQETEAENKRHVARLHWHPLLSSFDKQGMHDYDIDNGHGVALKIGDACVYKVNCPPRDHRISSWLGV